MSGQFDDDDDFADEGDDVFDESDNKNCDDTVLDYEIDENLIGSFPLESLVYLLVVRELATTYLSTCFS